MDRDLLTPGPARIYTTQLRACLSSSAARAPRFVARRRAPNDRHLHLITSCHATYANSVAMIPAQKQHQVHGHRLLAY